MGGLDVSLGFSVRPLHNFWMFDSFLLARPKVLDPTSTRNIIIRVYNLSASNPCVCVFLPLFFVHLSFSFQIKEEEENLAMRMKRKKKGRIYFWCGTMKNLSHRICFVFFSSPWQVYRKETKCWFDSFYLDLFISVFFFLGFLLLDIANNRLI